MSKKPTNAELQVEIKRLSKRVNELIDHNNNLKDQNRKLMTEVSGLEKITESAEKCLKGREDQIDRIRNSVDTLLAVKCPQSYQDKFVLKAKEQEPLSELELILRHIGALCGGDINPIY
jgi:predicted  nucleic acid-binding Zn-ribbon protein